MNLKVVERQLLQMDRVRAGYENASAPAKMGELLRNLRQAIGFSQREVARRSGVQQSEISRHEAGQARRGLTISQLETIAHAQGVEVVIGFAQKGLKTDDKALVIDGRTLLLHTVL